MLSLANSTDIVANRLSLVVGTDVTNILDLISSGGVDINTLVDSLISNQDFLDAINSSTGDAYTKTQSDNLYYTQSYLTNQFSLKLNSSLISSYSTTSQINDLLDAKVDTSVLSNYY